MASKKQIIFPIVAIAVAVAIAAILVSQKKPLEVKKLKESIPIVSTLEVEIAPKQLLVNSYGIVQPQFNTELIAQVTGEVVYVSEKFVDGGFVNEGDILIKIDPSDYQADVLEARANVAQAKANLVQEQAQAKVAEEEWKRIKTGTPTALSLRKPQLAQMQAKLDSAKARLQRSQRDLERTIIRAPFDALVEHRRIGLGAYASKGSQLGNVLSSQLAEVRLPVSDKDLQFLSSMGHNAKVKLKAEFAGEVQTWSAQIQRSEGVVDKQSKMTYLVAQVKDPYSLNNTLPPLRFGSYVTAEIEGQNIKQTTEVPSYLVNNNKVAILATDNTLQWQQVEVLREEGRNAVITAGLEQGTKLITSALDYPIAGMKLSESPMNAEDKLASEDITINVAEVKGQ